MVFLCLGEINPIPPRHKGPYRRHLGKFLFRPRAEQHSCDNLDSMGWNSPLEKRVFTIGYMMAGSITDYVAIHFVTYQKADEMSVLFEWRHYRLGSWYLLACVKQRKGELSEWGCLSQWLDCVRLSVMVEIIQNRLFCWIWNLLLVEMLNSNTLSHLDFPLKSTCSQTRFCYCVRKSCVMTD